MPEASSKVGRLAGFLTAHPRAVVAIWIALAVVLGFEGRGFGDASQPHPLLIDGSPSKRAHEIAERRFGDEQVLILELDGPAAAVRQQGRDLAARLDTIPDALVVSPWTGAGTIRGLAPSPGVAALIVRIGQGDEQSLTAVLPPIEGRIDAAISDPVRASAAGLPITLASAQNASEDATQTGELIAVPVLLLVLLWVFRSVVAAVIPIVSGGLVVIATQGVLTLISGLVQIDSFALGVIGMLGLALGVDYSLLVVSRYREESARGDVASAVRTTVVMVSRSILPAGCGLVLAGLVMLYLNPGALITSVGIATVVVTILSVISAICVVPAALVLLGDRVDRWELPRRKRKKRSGPPWFRRLSRRRPLVLGVALALGALAVLAPTLHSSVTTVELLPGGDPGRVQAEAIEASLGPGWVSPFEVLVDGNGAPVTTAARLRRMVEFQRRAEAIPGVETVAGFGPIEGRVERLGGLGNQLEGERRRLVRLSGGIEKASDAASRNTEGLTEATSGASRLARAVDEGGAGAGLLVQGLQATSSGSDQITAGLGRAEKGSAEVAAASSQAGDGAGRLSRGLKKEQYGVGQMRGTNRLLKHALQSGEVGMRAIEGPVAETEAELTAAWRALAAMGVGRGDPEYAAAVAALRSAIGHLSGGDPEAEGGGASPGGVHPGVEEVRGQLNLGLYLARKQGKTGRRSDEGLEALLHGATSLEQGLARLTRGGERLASAMAALSAGSQRLSPAVDRLTEGTEHLQSVLEQLGGGAGSLADGLAGGSQKSQILAGALRDAEAKLARGERGSRMDRVRRESPGLFDSGYFLLAGLDGAPPRRRDPLGFLVDLDEGGVGARLLVVPKAGVNGSGLGATRDRLQEVAARLERATDTEVAVGGLAAGRLDLDDAYHERIPLTRLALAVVTALVLLFVIRSLTMAIVASLFNLLTVAATFGLMSLLFDGSFLGGPGFVDAVAVLATVMLTFGLAADYETFVFARMREEYERTGSPSEAVDNGLEHVAPVITGAASIMIAVFLAFSVSSFTSIRNLGVGLAIGIFIDAFVLRLILLPAIMHALGRKAWWMPAWLDRVLPGGPAGASPGRVGRARRSDPRAG